MEIYAECSICGKWADLVRWGRMYGTEVCFECADELDKRSRGFVNRKVFEKLKKEMQDAKK